MNHLFHDARIALRGFRRAPAFALTAVSVLGIGMGMAVAMFTVVDAVLLRPLPVRDAAALVKLYTYRGDPNADFWLLATDLPKVAGASRTMRGIAGVAHAGVASAPFLDGDRPLVLDRSVVTANYFDVLGARPAIGRLFVTADEAAGAEPVLVISHGLWRSRFGGDPAIVGRRLREPYQRLDYRIVGVAPAGLDYPRGVDVWMPARLPAENLSVIAIARLAPGATPRAAQGEFLATMRHLFTERPYDGVHVETFAQAMVGAVKPVLVVLATAVGLLLLIACVNVGNLLLLRSATRARELSLRRALGASSGDLVRSLLVESALLGAAGGGLGLLAAQALLRVLLALAPANLPRTDVIGLSGTPVAIAAAVTIVSVVLFGVVPAVVASRGSPAVPLRLDPRAGTASRARRRLREALVAWQVALAVVLLAAAGLLARSFQRIEGIALGYDPEHLSLISFAFPPAVYLDSAGQFSQARVNLLGERLLSAIRAVPGVTSATPVVIPPFFGASVFIGRLDVEGQTPTEMESNRYVPLEAGGADYFRTFGIPIRRGRAFTTRDGATGAKVAIVSEATARRLWPGEDPIGKRIHYWDTDATAWRTVVGVAGDIRYRSLTQATPSVYLPWRQAVWQGYVAIRTSGDLADVLPALRRATGAIDPDVTMWDASPMRRLLAVPMAQPRVSALLLGAFAVVSMLLATIGLYGVMAFGVRAGTRELGVRLALGASPGRLRRGVLRRAVGVSALGVAVGLAIALGTSRLLSGLLYGVSPADPAAMLGAALLPLLVAAVGAWVPARHATRVDPVQVLRAD